MVSRREALIGAGVALERMLAMRSYMRAKTVDGRIDHAIAVLVNHAAEKTKASSTIERSSPGRPEAGAAGPATGGAGWVPTGTRKRFSGNPSPRCSRAHAAQAQRQPSSASKSAVSGQPTVLAKPASSVMPVMAPRASRP